MPKPEARTKGAKVHPASWNDRRASERVSTELKANLRPRGTSLRIKAEVLDVSTTGCRLRACYYSLGDQVLVTIAHLAPVPAHICWMRNDAIGVEFDTRLHPATVRHLAEL